MFNSNESTRDSATSKYHAQLYSGQKLLQRRQLQQQQQQQQQPHNYDSFFNTNKPMSINSKIISFEAPNLYQTSLQLTTEIDIHAWWSALVNIFSSNNHNKENNK